MGLEKQIHELLAQIESGRISYRSQATTAELKDAFWEAEMRRLLNAIEVDHSDPPDAVVYITTKGREALKGTTSLAGVRRLTVDLERKTATLDGKTYDVTSQRALRWLGVLADHPGMWISGPELAAYDSTLMNLRTDRLAGFLPREILRLIDSQTGIGSRIRL